MAFSIVEILSISVISISWILKRRLDADKYCQTNFGVSTFGSKENSGLVLCAKWKSKIDFYEIVLSTSNTYPNK